MSKPKPPDAALVNKTEAQLSTRALVIGGAGFLALLTALYLLVQSIGRDELVRMVEGAGFWGPAVYIAIKALTFTSRPCPPVRFSSPPASSSASFPGRCIRFWARSSAALLTF